tara:strand:+ start:3201 stop:3851 length:651 start_codon:yes stop_codon:yes gene_type:complete
MKKTALIVAGGRGIRMNASVPKQFLLLKNIPILMHTLEKFSHLDKIFLVLPKSQIEYWNFICNKYNFKTPHITVQGGETRFHSVKKGLEKIDDNVIVAIHDGVRPLVSTKLIDNLINNTKNGTGLVPVIGIKDSVRKIERGESVYIDRSCLYKVQTPQCFFSNDIKNAYNQEYSDKFTDDASVFESDGGKIQTILGEEENLKITTKQDLNIISSLF